MNTLTSLAGTAWKLNDTVSTFTKGHDFTNILGSDAYTNVIGFKLNMGYFYSNVYSKSEKLVTASTSTPKHCLLIEYKGYTSSWRTLYEGTESDSLTPNYLFNSDRFIVITDGEDVANPDLIEWFSANAVLLGDTASIRYGNKCLGILLSGQVARLYCTDQHMKDDLTVAFSKTGSVVYGDVVNEVTSSVATLNCKNTMMRNNLLIYNHGYLDKSGPILIGATIGTLPTKTVYEYKEPFDKTGGTVILHYYDGSTKEVSMSSTSIHGYKSSTPGTYAVVARYEEGDCSVATPPFTVTVKEPEKVCVEIIYNNFHTTSQGFILQKPILKLPIKVDIAERTVTLTGADGVVNTYTHGQTQNLWGVTKTRESTWFYDGLPDYEVTDYLPKYTVGQSFTITYGSIFREGGSSRIVDGVAYDVYELHLREANYTFTIDGNQHQIYAYNPNFINWVYSPYNTIGAKIIDKYIYNSDGTKQLYKSNGTTKVTATTKTLSNGTAYVWKSLSTPVNVTSITASPKKYIYLAGEWQSIGGNKITATLNDGSTTEVDPRYCGYVGFDSSTPTDEQIITVHYGGCTATYSIEIHASPRPTPVLSAVSIKTIPKTQYKLGESLDVEGGVLLATYVDGSSRDIPFIYDTGFNDIRSVVQGFDKIRAPGEYELTVACAQNGVLAKTSYIIKVTH